MPSRPLPTPRSYVTLVWPQHALREARYAPLVPSEVCPPAYATEAAAARDGAGGTGGAQLELLQCIEMQRRAETLTGDDRWFCSGCKAHVDVTKR